MLPKKCKKLTHNWDNTNVTINRIRGGTVLCTSGFSMYTERRPNKLPKWRQKIFSADNLKAWILMDETSFAEFFLHKPSLPDSWFMII